MPYYKWQGVDLMGKSRRGRMFARSEHELDGLLFERDIALLNVKPIKEWSFISRVGLPIKIEFFKQLSAMVQAGVLLPEALQVVGDQASSGTFQHIIYTIARDVQEGSSLSKALEKYPQVFDPLMIALTSVGEESGRLPGALHALANYLDASHDVRKRIHAAVLLPGLTMGFFCIIALVIFVFIVPTFITLFASMRQELPTITKRMIQISSFVRSWRGISALGIFAALFVAGKSFVATARGAWLLDTALLRLPFVGTVVLRRSLATFLQATSILLDGGMQLVAALKLAKNAVGNSVIKEQIVVLANDVETGSSLSKAMVQASDQMFGPELISLVKVGEQTGNLSVMLNKASWLYHENTNRSILVITSLINPLLMIVLGLLITMLIFAVYVPVLNVSQALQI